MNGFAGRLPRLAGGLVVAAAVGAVLTSCSGSSGASLAKQACVHVDRAAEIYSASPNGAPTGSAAHVRIESELNLAEPLAAEAAGNDPTWQALQANLQEAHGQPPADILPALRADCASTGSERHEGPGSSGASQ